MTSVTPFKIPLCEKEVADLKVRLGRLRWPDPLPGSPWQCGVNGGYLRSFCEYWRDSYDWPAQVARLNKIPQFSVPIDGVPITFWHIKGIPTGPPAIPLILLHGWPGSQIEFEAVIGPLSDPAALGATSELAFDVVVPSIPGFGFSGKPQDMGWNADRIADALNSLMTDVLGYRNYGVQGGDWGTLIGTRMALRHPANLIGFHLNMPSALPPPGAPPDPARLANWEMLTGYLHLQSTKPDTVTYGQSDSPLALAAWILDKFYTWGDCDGDIESAFSRDTLITNLMYYWLPNSAASAARIYYESARMTPPLFQAGRVTVPTGIAAFPKEPYRSPRSWLEPAFEIVHWTDLKSGGHFPALERPESLINDIRKFFKTVGGSDDASHRRLHPDN